MVWFIIGILAVIAAVVLLAVSRYARREHGEGLGSFIGAGVAIVVAGISMFLASSYTQDEGEASVLRAFTGEVVGQDLDPGLSFKAPWVDPETFDIRNQMVAYVGDGSQNYNGAPANGPQITTADEDGVRIDFDLAVNFSIQPDAVTDIYREFRNQENFRARFIEQDVRSISRIPFAQYTAQEALASRGEIALAIEEALRAKWEDRGVMIRSVALQEIRPPQSVMDSINEAQQARINVEREEANLAAAEVRAQTRVAEATAQAEANRLLTESLTDDVLAQRYLDTLTEVGRNGNLIVVPEGFNGILNMPGRN
jgi:regulator of protease activity HflC (stomatin/prohibitin superfamily)